MWCTAPARAGVTNDTVVECSRCDWGPWDPSNNRPSQQKRTELKWLMLSQTEKLSEQVYCMCPSVLLQATFLLFSFPHLSFSCPLLLKPLSPLPVLPSRIILLSIKPSFTLFTLSSFPFFHRFLLSFFLSPPLLVLSSLLLFSLTSLV